ncbi:MAG: ABC transporter ATP-binding protein, partial [Acidobacteriaceae bacterium]|nr:ABC transporter ATP-binding protein [Acidobacteriaceae bacterium]
MNEKNIVVEAQQLRKTYGPRLALDCVSLEVRAGEVVGLLGPNGAGKTTTLSILATLISPDSGILRILGFDAGKQQSAIRKYLGLVPQSLALYPSLSAVQNLRLFLRIHGLDNSAARAACAQALETVGLADRA